MTKSQSGEESSRFPFVMPPPPPLHRHFNYCCRKETGHRSADRTSELLLLRERGAV